ncbi:hypothetical protein M0R45_033768 [Rubus argutus]|uniref:F-box domain-containing protein n=1 Tax=Rubus argutus TaxID=59490 RepID=A0AAW1WN90_RUBAR
MDSNWEKLPGHLLSYILNKVELLSDYLQCTLVCRSWNGAAKDCESQLAKMRSCYRPPMLLISNSTDEDNTWNVYSIIDNKVLDMQLEMPNVRFCGSSNGWLITMDKNFVVILVNPFFRVKGRRKENSIIRLPPMNFPSHFHSLLYKKYAYKAIISADPILNANDCIVVVIYEEQLRLAFIRLGKDATWTYIDESCRPIDDVIYAQHKFYAADGKRGKLLSFDISTSVVECVAPGVRQKGDYLKKYLVDSDGKRLLMVQRDITYATWKRATTQIEVRELDFDKYWWKRKNTLDGLAIFLGDNSSVSVLASNFPGCQPNCIYFNHDTDRMKRKFEDSGPHDFGIYNIEDKTFQFGTYSPQDRSFSQIFTLLKTTNQPPIWVVPTFQI